MNWSDENGTDGLIKRNSHFNFCVCICVRAWVLLCVRTCAHMRAYVRTYACCVLLPLITRLFQYWYAFYCSMLGDGGGASPHSQWGRDRKRMEDLDKVWSQHSVPIPPAGMNAIGFLLLTLPSYSPVSAVVTNDVWYIIVSLLEDLSLHSFLTAL